MPSVTLPSKIFTFMRKHSPKFSCRITPLTPSMLEVVTALAAEEEHSTSPHSKAASSARDAQGTPSQSAAQASIFQGTADVTGRTDNSQGTASLQGTAASLGTARLQGTAAIPTSPNDYTPTDASQTSGGDEGLLDIYALNREVRRLKKQTLSQAKQILKLKAKLKKLSKFVQPVVKHHAFWVESQNLKKQKRRRKKQRKKVTLNFEDEAGPSSPLRPIQVMESEEQLKVAEVLVAMSRPREEIALHNQTLETTNDEECKKDFKLNGCRKRSKKFEELMKAKPKTTLRTSVIDSRMESLTAFTGEYHFRLYRILLWNTALS
ncbi:hypothetical protein Tco_1530507 [Tanacetum coccineum]